MADSKVRVFVATAVAGLMAASTAMAMGNAPERSSSKTPGTETSGTAGQNGCSGKGGCGGKNGCGSK